MPLGWGFRDSMMPKLPLSVVGERGFLFGSPADLSSGLRKSGSCHPQCSQRHGQIMRFAIMEMTQTLQIPNVITVKKKFIFQ